MENSKIINFRSKQATITKLGTQSCNRVVNFCAKNHIATGTKLLLKIGFST